ncbi:MurR/RpiR family transcriptional regulator [Acidocella sp.]|jgi:DNA-binding MurR/RpiR family transcriptional regulator|uniref:MurR/RpiR family transcriptional regulator n=1 Tax=Acidocella sp. TaxID=50710 RepID=UPI002F41A75F
MTRSRLAPKPKLSGGAQEVPASAADAEPDDRLSAQVHALKAELSPTVLRVARYLDRNRVVVLTNSAAELAASIGTSDATVVRTVQMLGFQGLGELRQAIAASISGSTTPLDNMRRTLQDLSGPAETEAMKAADLVLDTHRESLRQTQTAGGRAPIHQAIAALHPVERIVIYAAGPSTAIAAYLEVMLNRHGRRAKVIGHGGLGLADQLLDLSAQDGLLMLSYGESYREVLLTASEAAARQIPIVLVTDKPETKLAKTAAVVLPARRGRAEQVALHGATLITLEALLMGLAVANRAHTIETLERLAGLRAALAKPK